MEKIVIGNVLWLRNDYKSDITVGGITYPTVEHAYQASKLNDFHLKLEISQTDSIWRVRNIVKENYYNNPYFNPVVVMASLLRLKFSDKELGYKLANTGHAEIVMEGYNDFWGTGKAGNGKNQMGELLQTIRAELQFLLESDTDQEDDQEDDCFCTNNCCNDGCWDNSAIDESCCNECCCNECGNCDEDVCDDEDWHPTLEYAVFNCPDEYLAYACQCLYDTSKEILSLIDVSNYNIEFISKKTGLPKDRLEEALNKVKNFQAALSNIDHLLEEQDED